MPLETIIDNEFVSLWYDPERGMVSHVFHRFLAGDAFRDALNAGTHTLKKRRATKWLSDDRNNSALSAADGEWAKTDWFPRTLRAGWKYWALVQPTSVIGKMNMKRFTEPYAKMGLTVRVFDDPTAALAWLDEQK